MNNGYGFGYSPMQNLNYQTRVQQPIPNNYPQYQPTYMQQQLMTIKGRPVTSIDEAKAAQIDLDGTITYFPSPAENKIYVKSIGFDGLPIFNIYQLADSKQSQPVYADNNLVISLQQRVENLEKIVQGVSKNVQPNANSSNDGTNSTI